MKFGMCKSFGRYVAIILAAQVVMLQPLTFASVLDAKSPDSIVIFPTANEAGAANDLANALTMALSDAIGQKGDVQVIPFNPRNPSVQRALKEQRLRDSDITGSIDFDKAVRIGKELGVNYVLVSALEEYTYNKEAGAVTVATFAQLGDPASGRLITGSNAAGAASGADLSETSLGTLAVKDAAGKLAAAINPQMLTTILQPVKIGGKKKSKTLIYALLAGALIWAISSGSDSGGSNDNPPPPPL